MATNEIKLTLRVDDEGSLNIVAKEATAAAGATDKLDKSTKKTNKSRSSYNKVEKGVAGATSNSTKAFTKQASSISGGLVPAYAVLAANIFAITAAFGALQRAAQVEQLTQGLGALGRASGLAMNTLSTGLVEATGHALSLEEAMRSTALITSAGLDPSSIQRFGEVARNASVALGRDTADSLARLTRGITKLEPELLDELGIMVRIDEATQSYATSLGKSASDLSQFEKRQAFLNATLEQGEKKFGAIGGEVDTNPYDKLAATFLNLSKVILGLINTAISPLVAFLAASPTALFGVLTVFAGTIVGKMVPAFSDLKESAEKSQIATKAMAATQVRNIANLKGASDTVTLLSKKMAEGTEEEGDFTSAIRGNNQSLRERKVKLTDLSQSQNSYLRVIQLTVAGEKAQAAALKEQILATKQAAAVKNVLTRNTFDLAIAKTQGSTATALEAFEQEGLTKGLKEGTKVLGKQAVATLAGAKNSTLLAGASILASGAMSMMGTAALFAGKAISMIAPWITGIAIAMSILGPVLSFVMDLFTSDATKKYDEQSKSLSETMKELASNAREVNRAMLGQSVSITTAGQEWTAYANILSQFNTEYDKLAALGRESGNFDAQRENMQELVESSDRLKAAFKEKFGTSEIEDLNKTEQESVRIAREFIGEQTKSATALQGLSVTLKETGQAFGEYINEAKITTPLDNVVAGFTDVANQLKSAQDSGEDFSSILNDLNSAQISIFNVEAETKAIAGVDKLIKESQARATKAKADASSSSFDQKNLEGTLKKELALQDGLIQGRNVAAGTALEQFNIEKAIFEEQQKTLMISKVQQDIYKTQKQLITETYAEGEAAARRQLDLDARISEAKLDTLQVDKEMLQSQLNRTTDTKQAVALIFKIAQLENNISLEKAKQNSPGERALVIQKARIAALKEEQTAAKAFLDIANRAASVESARLSTAEKAAKLAAKQANRKDPSRTTGGTLLPSDEAKIAKDLLQRRLKASEQEEKLKKSGLKLEMTMLKAKLMGVRAELQVINEKRSLAGGTLLDLLELDTAIDSIAENGELRVAAESALTEQYKTQRDVLNDIDENTDSGALKIIERINEENKLLEIRKQMNTVTSKGVDALAEANRIQKEMSVLANTNVMGNVISAKEAARISERSRQQELVVAQRKYNLAVEMAGIQADVLTAEHNLLVAKMAADGVTTEAEKKVIAASERLLEAKFRVSNQELENTRQSVKLLGNQLKQDGIQSIATARAASGATGPGANMAAVTAKLGGVSQAIKDDDKLTNDEKKKQLIEAQKAAAKGLLAAGAEDLGKLGPEGALAQSAINGALTVSDAFKTMQADMDGEGTAGKFAAVATAVGAAMGAVQQMQQAATNAKIANIDKEINAEKRRDGQSAASVSKIAAMEKRKEAVKKKAFESTKKAQMAMVVINTAASIAANIAAASHAAIYAGIGAPAVFAGTLGMLNAVTLGLGVAQLGVIAGTSYQGGGAISGGGGGGGGSTSIAIGSRGNKSDLARSQGARGELAYSRGEDGTGGMGSFKPAFAGAKYRANGGQTAGYVVGEQGPELFVPQTAGTIVANDGDEPMGASPNVNFNINAVDASGVEDLLVAQRGNIIGMIREAANSYGQDFVEDVDTSMFTQSAGGVSKY